MLVITSIMAGIPLMNSVAETPLPTRETMATATQNNEASRRSVVVLSIRAGTLVCVLGALLISGH